MMNTYILILVSMLFGHVIDDYCLQSFSLCNLKQKSWWEANAPDQKHSKDYVVGLICHSVSWAFMIMLPIIIFTSGQLNWLWGMFPINVIVHAIVDDTKANRGKLNLIQDQLIHLTQIVITWILFIIIC